MELTQLTYFVAAAKADSLTEAAQSLNVTQSALSKSISKLEDEIGTQLFSRNGRKLILNQAGQAFLRYAETVLVNLSDGMEAVKNVQLQNAGHTFTIAGTFPHLHQLVAEAFFLENPNRRCTSILSSYEDVLDNIIKFQYDCALSLDPYILDTRIHWDHMLRERLVALTSVAGRYASRKELTAKDLEYIPVILTDGEFEQHARYISLCQRAGFYPVIRFQGLELCSAASMLSIPDTIIVLPVGEAVELQKLHPELKYRLLRMPENFYRDIGIIRRNEGNESAEMDCFYKCAASFFRQYDDANNRFLEEKQLL